MDLLRGGRLPALTVTLLVIFAASAWLHGELTGAVAMILVLANTLPLLLIRWNPLVVVLMFAVTYPWWLDPAWAGGPRDGHVLQSLPTVVALYATGAWNRPLWWRAVGLITPAWMLGAAVTGYWTTQVGEIIYIAMVLVTVWVLGVVDASRRAHVEALEQRTRELQQAREALAEQAVAEERARIARELHDVVAHAMSVITVQAGVGGHLLPARPDRAAESLGIIERTGREALDELRRMLIVLHHENDGGAQPPQPGLADLPALLDAARARGLTVSLERAGEVPPLPAGLDLAAYRVVQEGLTNAVKHAPGSAVAVRVAGDVERLSVEVRDRGAGAPAGVRHGQGLTGMTERVALYDGSLLVDGRDGFRVRACFPLPERPS